LAGAHRMGIARRPAHSGLKRERPALNLWSEKKVMLHGTLCVTLFDSKSRKEPNNV
jgi:hypothetical protein